MRGDTEQTVIGVRFDISCQGAGMWDVGRHQDRSLHSACYQRPKLETGHARDINKNYREQGFIFKRCMKQRQGGSGHVWLTATAVFGNHN